MLYLINKRYIRNNVNWFSALFPSWFSHVSLGTEFVSRYFRRRESPTRSSPLLSLSISLSHLVSAQPATSIVLAEPGLVLSAARARTHTLVSRARNYKQSDNYCRSGPAMTSGVLLLPRPLLLLLFCRRRAKYRYTRTACDDVQSNAGNRTR